MGVAFLQALELGIVSLYYPTVLAQVFDSRAGDESAKVEEDSLESAPEQLPAESRETIVKNMILYSYERPCTVAAIEVATIMLLEVQYGWSPEFGAFCFIVVGASSLVLTASSILVLSRKCMAQSSVFIMSSTASLFGVFLLFDWTSLGPGGLLLADAVVYGFASVSNGVAEGWAARAATKGTSYSIETYRLNNIIGVCLSRFLAPIAARFMLDFGGRNAYAVAQLLLCFLGTSTVYRTVRLVWRADLRTTSV